MAALTVVAKAAIVNVIAGMTIDAQGRYGIAAGARYMAGMAFDIAMCPG